MHCLPKIVGIKVSGELWVKVDNMDVAFLIVPYDRFVVITCTIGFDFDTKGSVHL